MDGFPGLKDKFCENPWTYCEIYAGGGVYACCPAWNYNKFIGNIFHHTPEQIWNSQQAQAFRQGILDGSYCECDHQKCPSLIARSLPTREEARQSWLGPILADAMDQERIIAVHGPSVVKIGYDASCNLSCPSCRDDIIIMKKKEQEQLNHIRDNFIIPFLKDAKVLVMSSDGDPFASNHYREILKITAESLPHLKLGICTNGVLMDEHAWTECRLEGRVVSVQISIDAAKTETYNYVRRGGNFERLKRNLAFLAAKRAAGQAFSLDLLFVVQACNFREMPAFVELGESFGATSVQFMLIDHWGRAMESDAYKASKIWDREHPEYREFVSVLHNDVLRRPVVKLGNVEAILRSEQPPELHIDFKSGQISRSAANNRPLTLNRG